MGVPGGEVWDRVQVDDGGLLACGGWGRAKESASHCGRACQN